MGRCAAPCQLTVSTDQYEVIVAGVRAVLAGELPAVVESVRRQLRSLIDAERYEEAGVLTARVEELSRALLRHHRLSALASCAQIVAALPVDGNWEIHVIRYGRLAASALALPGIHC